MKTKLLVLLTFILALCFQCSKATDEIDELALPPAEPLVESPDSTGDPTPPPADPTPRPDQASQIIYIYTDIEPNFSSDTQNTSYGLDLNNDQKVDYILQWNDDDRYEWLAIRSNPEGQNGIISVAPWYSNPVPLGFDTEIFTTPYDNSRSLFYDTWGIFTIGDCPTFEPRCFYDWKGAGDSYLGLRFKINGAVHYGWVRMQISSPANWVVKDYAYNATPNEPVFAGRQ